LQFVQRNDAVANVNTVHYVRHVSKQNIMHVQLLTSCFLIVIWCALMSYFLYVYISTKY